MRDGPVFPASRTLENAYVFNISEGLLFGLLVIPMLAFLIIAHELGHFFAARSVGVTVEEFGIGLPPRAKGWRRKGVLWSLNWIPFGGFVRVKGEDGTDMSAGSMNVKKPWQRAWFLVAGPLMNFLVAIILSIILIAFQGLPSKGSHIYIGQVSQGSPAEHAGWMPGDAIVAVDGEQIATSSQLQSAISSHAGAPASVTILRGGQEIVTIVTPRKDPPKNQGATGITMGEGINSSVKFDRIDANSPAATSGLQSGDTVVSINGVPIDAVLQASSMLQNAQGSSVPIVVHRDGKDVGLTLAVPRLSVIVTAIAADTPAEAAKLFREDRITAIDGKPVTDGTSFRDALIASSGRDVTVDFVRNVATSDGAQDKALQVTMTVPELKSDANPFEVIGVNASAQSPYNAIGAGAIFQNVYNRVPTASIVPEGWNQFWGITTGTVDGLKRIVSTGIPEGGLVGPVGMGQMTSELLTQSPTPKWVTITQITVVISVSLGIMNLLPLPALDGGRLLFVIIEFLRGGKRIAPEKEGMVHLAGMVLLLGLMFVVAFGDVSRLFDGTSILP